MRLPSPEVIGQNIARLRHQHRWSQRELAQKIDVHQTLVFRWEKGLANPKGDMLLRLAEVLEASIDELVTLDASIHDASGQELPKDQELRKLLGLVSSFEPDDLKALKIFIEALATKNRVKSALQLT
jgi:transcriptional regulator with XRE-family HTH domain